MTPPENLSYCTAPGRKNPLTDHLGAENRMLPDAERFRRLVDGRQRGLFPAIARTGLAAAAVPYGAAVSLRNLAFDYGLLTVERATVPVISVGNLTVGGTGKTPLVAWLAEQSAKQGWRPAIVSRGYGVADGERSDEAAELGLLLPNVPHHAARRRIVAARAATASGATLIILDDGFQHRRLARDLNLLVIDATDPFGCSRLLPRGLLRESVAGMRRADAIILTRSDRVPVTTRQQIQAICRQQLGQRQVPWLETEHRPRELRAADGSCLPLKTLEGRRLFGFAGIGNPAPFRGLLEEPPHELVGFRSFPDHHPYSGEDVARLAHQARNAGADLAVTTLKDLVKLPREGLPDMPLLAVVIGLTFTSDPAPLEQLLRGVRQEAID